MISKIFDSGKKMMQFLKRRWIILTVLFYCVFIILYTLAFMFLVEGKNQLLPSNELGDFLAGVFAPLAFFILIMGYIQQGRELKLQAQELAKSVEVQAKIAELNQKQFDYLVKDTLMKNQPSFDIVNDLSKDRTTYILYLKLVIISGVARNIYIEESDEFDVTNNLHHILSANDPNLSSFEFSLFDSKESWHRGRNLPIKISYEDITGTRNAQDFRIFYTPGLNSIERSMLESYNLD